MKKINIIFWMLLSIAFLKPSYARTYTLEQLLNLGLKNNPLITASKHALQAGKYGEKAAHSQMGPKLTSKYIFLQKDKAPTLNGVQIGDKHLWIFELNLHQPLFTGTYLLNSYQKAKIQKEQLSQQIKKVRLEIAFQIKQTYFNLLKGKALVKSISKSIERLQNHLKVIENFYKLGLKPKIEVLQAKTELAKTEQQIIEAKNFVSTQKALLATLANLSEEPEVKDTTNLEYIPFLLSLAKCQQEALKNRPEIFIAQKSIEVAEKEEKMAKSAFFPQIGADATYYRYGTDPDVKGTPYEPPSKWEVSIGAKWVLFESGSTMFKVKQAKQNIYRLKSIYHDLKNKIKLEVKTAYLNLQSAKQSILATKKALAEAKETFLLATARYEANLGSNTDVLDAQAKLTEAESKYISALANYNIALANLQKSMGQEEIIQ
ncbi:Outer membrane protein TolC [Desulfonauticus submarinus]|uniref:Outer membrane protein TolC n=1 Tax=Desulfonauticus submarinus TaxID=206665 RepID=A0A1H0BBP7_9BACT|nr:TolC family protein [Desulfonauticus submarinus]SDN43059.1 Outer membrane protein TolC [Desulfonauticus submarinus]